MSLSPQARECRNRYMREWRKKHPERAREGRVSYWEKRAAAEAAAEDKNTSEQKENTK